MPNNVDTKTASKTSPKVRPKKKAAYVDLLPPCNNACPAGENIQQWLGHLMAGDVKEAFNEIVKNNPLPATHGRVCYHPCEDFCNRIQFDGAVSIHSCEREIGDKALKEGWQINVEAPNSGKKILVIGSGPAGLTCAYFLRRLGYEVSIYEKDSIKGGMMHTGIPAYRLPREIIDAEIERIENIGISIECNREVKDVLQEKVQGDFDAVFLAVGAGCDKIIPITNDNPLPIIGAIDFLKSIEFGEPISLGEHVAVYGGGNTAIDVMRSALRVGVKKATMIYRRKREYMPAFGEEIEDAEQEGVEFCFLRTIRKIVGNELDLEIMELDADGRLQGTGSFEAFNADSLVLALGQNADTEFLKEIENIDRSGDGTISVAENYMTGMSGIFAGGDVITYDRSVTKAVGCGKKAAHHINAYLCGEEYIKGSKHELADFSKLHLAEAEKIEGCEHASMPVKKRMQDFSEVVLGFSEKQALKEAKRCFSCGNCFECDKCYNVCPVKAITKLGKGKRYRIDKKVCIGCTLCFRKCPCGAIEMIEEGSKAGRQ